MTSILSIDVEEWFHILDLKTAPKLSEWPRLDSRIERNFGLLLDILEEADVTATCFFLGWIAETYPHLVLEANHRGHEIASHGYSHQLVYSQTPEEFLADITRAKVLLEDLTGKGVQGYRAPGFSIVDETPWALEALVKAGYRYDSSIFPATRGHGGIRTSQVAPHVINTSSGPIMEFPISVLSLLGKRLCCSGGGYFRLTPYRFVQLFAQNIKKQGRPVIYYIHPRDIDPEQPRITMPLIRQFKTYVNLRQTEEKCRRLTREVDFVPFRSYLNKIQSCDRTTKDPV